MKLIKFFIVTVVAFCVFALSNITFVFAQQPSGPPKDAFMTAEILKLQKPTDTSNASDNLQVKILEGNEKGNVVTLAYDPSALPDVHLKNGDTIVIAKIASFSSGKSRYYFVDQKRTFPVVIVTIGFLLLFLVIAGWKGIGSIIGLVISLGVIFLYIVPQIINGTDSLTACMTGAMIILFVTTYVAHGFSKQTTIALLSTFLALVLTFYISQFVTSITLLNGYGDQELADLHYGIKTIIDIKGIFLGGVILATLGALNDITITQVTAIFALHKTNSNFSFKELWSHGFIIGREHAISLVNTLVLAYAGTALPLFIFLLYNPNSQPWWVMFNSEFLNEEMMRTIVGTAGLLLSVPIATFLATTFCNKKVTGFLSEFIYAWVH